MQPPIKISSSLTQKLSGASWIEQKTGKSNSRVFRIDWSDRPSLFVKWGAGLAADLIANENSRLEWLSAKTLAPKVEHFEYDGQDAYLLTTAIPGSSAKQFMGGRGSESLETIKATARFLRLFHQLEIDSCPFDASRKVFLRQARENIDNAQVDPSDFDAERLNWTSEQVWSALQQIQPGDEDLVVIHGDFTLNNILMADGQVTGCIDVGRLGVGDRYHDIAIFWRSLRKFGDTAQHKFLREYGLDDIDRPKLEFHLLLDELF